MGGTEFPADLWSRFGQAYDEVFTEPNHRVAEVALERSGLRAGMSVLDVAAGGGALSIPAARMGADVLATDLSATMLELLEQRASAIGVGGIRTAVMDGTALEVGERRFDRVCSEYGVMFFLDPGLQEMRRVMAPGGRAIVIAWGHPDRVALTVYRLAIARALGPERAPAELPVVRDPDILVPAMREAGFTEIDVFTHDEPYPATSGEDVWRWMRDVSPGYASLIAAMPPAEQEAVHEATLEVTRERYGDGFASLPMEALIAIGA